MARFVGKYGATASGYDGDTKARAVRCLAVEASSGKTVRHRLNRGRNRDANRALHVICAVRLRRHQPTRDCLARRTAEGKTKAEIMRCLKRYIACEVYRAVQKSGPETIAQHRSICYRAGQHGVGDHHTRFVVRDDEGDLRPRWPAVSATSPRRLGRTLLGDQVLATDIAISVSTSMSTVSNVVGPICTTENSCSWRNRSPCCTTVWICTGLG